MNKSWIFLSVCTTVVLSGKEGKRHPETFINVRGLGKIRGSVHKTYLTKRDFSAFTSIPYARVAKRFSLSVEITQLTPRKDEVFDATRRQTPCPQIAPIDLVPGSNDSVEECLTLNIYTPTVRPVDSSTGLPVIVFIHGGSFTRWSGNMWSGVRLLERDVVLVTFNYRLGLSGFFCLGNDEAPGNGGMYDMVAALRWVQKYISYFGGDPTRVTIAGQSSGGASVTWLLDSPLARGLFQNAMALSGTDVNYWAIQNSPIETSLSGAQTLLCMFYLKDENGKATEVPDKEKILLCMRDLPVGALSIPLNLKTFYPAPCVQNFSLTIPKFAPSHPLVSMAEGQQNSVPLIIGTTKNDGTFLLGRLRKNLLATNLLNSTEFMQTQLLSRLFRSWGLVDNPPGYLNSLVPIYFGGSSVSGNWTEMVPGLTDLLSVVPFKLGALIIANHHSCINANTYLYSFDFFDSGTYYSSIGGDPEVPRGVTHTDDLCYIFDHCNFTRREDMLISLFMVNSWVNFATTGDPNKRTITEQPSYNPWPKWNTETHEFIKINVTPTKSNDYEGYWVKASENIAT